MQSCFKGSPSGRYGLCNSWQWPAGFQLSASLSRSKLAGQTVAISIMFFFAFPLVATACAATLVVAVAAIGQMLLSRKSQQCDSLTESKRLLAIGAATFLGLTLPTIVGVNIHAWEEAPLASAFLEPLFWYRVAVLSLGPGLLLIVATWIAVRFPEALRERRLPLATIAITWLLVQLGFYLAPQFFDHDPHRQSDAEFVASVLPDDPALTVHWPHPLPSTVWFKLRKNCFFSWQQTAGSMFNRETACEAARRAKLVAQLDLGTHTALQWGVRDRELESLIKLYGVNSLEVALEGKDLIRVCQDPEVDFVVSRLGVNNLYRATNGRWFVYDCAAVRESRFAADILAAAR